MLSTKEEKKSDNFKLKGFTLLEMILAIFVLVVGILSIMSLIQGTISANALAVDRLTAVYLAQEGIELVRNKRDSNWLAEESWNDKLPTNTENNLLGKFTRNTEIAFEDIDGDDKDDKAVVTITISWQKGGNNYSLSLQGELYNWKK